MISNQRTTMHMREQPISSAPKHDLLLQMKTDQSHFKTKEWTKKRGLDPRLTCHTKVDQDLVDHIYYSMQYYGVKQVGRKPPTILLRSTYHAQSITMVHHTTYTNPIHNQQPKVRSPPTAFITELAGSYNMLQSQPRLKICSIKMTGSARYCPTCPFICVYFPVKNRPSKRLNDTDIH